MIGKLHITTLSGPADSAGSSELTVASGSGRNWPASFGAAGSDTSIACRPAECHVTSATSPTTVGLWAEKLVDVSVNGLEPRGVLQNDSTFSGRLNSAITSGAVGSRTSSSRTQPH